MSFHLEHSKITLRDSEFRKLGTFIYSNFGIKLPPSKKFLLEGRLQRRLKATQKKTFKEYIDFVLSEEGAEEIVHMIDRVSTNKTDFFREDSHFHFMSQELLPEMDKAMGPNEIKIWSSASSSGEEIYTLAMVMEEYIEEHQSNLSYSILGTDISMEKLQQAHLGIYQESRVVPIPLPLKKKYLLRSKVKENKQVRIVPLLRNKTSFKRLNLMDSSYGFKENFDIIFCRNVLIYFDKPTQKRVIEKQCDHLKKGGFLFLGHSESILRMDLPLKQVNPTIYKKL